MVANGLEGAYLLDPSLVVLADATGARGAPADLLASTPQRVRRRRQRSAERRVRVRRRRARLRDGVLPDARARTASGPSSRSRLARRSVGAPRSSRRAIAVGVALSAVGALTLARSRGAGREPRRSAAATRSRRSAATPSRAWARWSRTRSGTRWASSGARWSSCRRAAAARAPGPGPSRRSADVLGEVGPAPPAHRGLPRPRPRAAIVAAPDRPRGGRGREARAVDRSARRPRRSRRRSRRSPSGAIPSGCARCSRTSSSTPPRRARARSRVRGQALDGAARLVDPRRRAGRRSRRSRPPLRAVRHRTARTERGSGSQSRAGSSSATAGSFATSPTPGRVQRSSCACRSRADRITRWPASSWSTTNRSSAGSWPRCWSWMDTHVVRAGGGREALVQPRRQPVRRRRDGPAHAGGGRARRAPRRAGARARRPRSCS